MSTREGRDEQPALGQICIQVHPQRTASLDLHQVKRSCEALAKATPGVRGIGFSEGQDDGDYLNIVMASESPLDSWRLLAPQLFGSLEFGAQLRGACLCMCTGEDGWNDYRLLHHFDPAVPLDHVDEA